MDPLAPFPDVETAFLQRLSEVDGTQGGTYLPADFKSKMPYWRVYRFTGSRTSLEDFPTLSVELFAEKRSVGRPLAELGDQLLMAAPWQVTIDGDIVGIDSVSTTTGPREIPWGDAGVRRWEATYTVVLRR